MRRTTTMQLTLLPWLATAALAGAQQGCDPLLPDPWDPWAAAAAVTYSPYCCDPAPGASACPCPPVIAGGTGSGYWPRRFIVPGRAYGRGYTRVVSRGGFGHYFHGSGG